MVGSRFRQTFRGVAAVAGALALGAVATAGDSVAASGERRVALVIGNAAYDAVGALDNPIQDAKGMSAALKRLGFEVVEGYDLKYDDMRATLGDYARKLDGAKAALVYYAGHGVSVAGENYLLPTDASLKSEADLDLKTINIDLVTRQMQREDRVSILILDACRNNPFKAELERSVARSRVATVASGGLAEIKSQSSAGMLIAFATDPGRTAQDGERGGNSPFAAALMKHMEASATPIETVLTRVRGDVFSATKGKQTPWVNTSLRGEFFLGQPPQAQVPPTAGADRPAAPSIDEAPSPAPAADLTKEVGTAATEATIKLTPSEHTEAQQRLRALGFDPGRAGATFQPVARKAIADWQGSRNIAETGYLTLVQVEALWAQSEAGYQAMVAAPATERRARNAPEQAARPVVTPRQRVVEPRARVVEPRQRVVEPRQRAEPRQRVVEPRPQPRWEEAPRRREAVDHGGNARAAAFGSLVGGLVGGALRGF